MSSRNRRPYSASLDCKMAACDSDSVHSGDSSVLLCIGEPFLGSLTNLDGFGKIRGGCTNPLHNCSCYVRFEHQLSFACLNCQGLCPAFSHVSEIITSVGSLFRKKKTTFNFLSKIAITLANR